MYTYISQCDASPLHEVPTDPAGLRLGLVISFMSVSVCCSAVQCVAVRCSALQCVAACLLVHNMQGGVWHYGVALVSRIDKFIGLFCKRDL